MSDNNIIPFKAIPSAGGCAVPSAPATTSLSGPPSDQPVPDAIKLAEDVLNDAARQIGALDANLAYQGIYIFVASSRGVDLHCASKSQKDVARHISEIHGCTGAMLKRMLQQNIGAGIVIASPGDVPPPPQAA